VHPNARGEPLYRSVSFANGTKFVNIPLQETHGSSTNEASGRHRMQTRPPTTSEAANWGGKVRSTTLLGGFFLSAAYHIFCMNLPIASAPIIESGRKRQFSCQKSLNVSPRSISMEAHGGFSFGLKFNAQIVRNEQSLLNSQLSIFLCASYFDAA
jgi:hypothetical protein